MCINRVIKLKSMSKKITPKMYKLNEVSCQRKMLCSMVNHYLSIQSQFYLNNENIFKNSLLDIFEDKIMSFFQFYRFKPESSQAVVKIYTFDSILFNQYFKQSGNFKMQYLSKSMQFNPDFKMLFGYSHPCVDLIQLIFNGKEIEMMLDLNSIFTKTIYSRMKQEISTKPKPESSYIHISQDGVKTKLHKQMNKKSLTKHQLSQESEMLAYSSKKGKDGCQHIL